MDNNFNKLQIRAKVLSVLSDIKSDTSLNQTTFDEYIETLREIEDKDALFDILLKELGKSQGDTAVYIKAMFVEAIPNEELKNKILSLLTSKKVGDQTKYDLIQVLRDIGATVDYDNFFSYFSDPDSILDYDTQKLLEFAIVNPETQIDFLDFLTALPSSDRLMLINSLNDDYSGDNLANILVPILYSDFDDDVLKRTIEILGETRSSIAYNPIEWIYNHSDNDLLVSVAKKNLSQLKLSGASEKKAKSFYKLILSESKVHKCYTTIPDGHSNQGILVVRYREDESYQMFALVVNHIYGIVDCFGFNSLSLPELERIVTRFCKNDTKIEVSPEYCKTIVDKAVKINEKLKEKISYEFVCWSHLLKDVDALDYTLEEWAKSNLKQIELNHKGLEMLFAQEYLDRWFFTTSDNEGFKTLLTEIMENPGVTFENVEEKISQKFDEIWTEEAISQLEYNLLNTAYLVHKLNDINNANAIYSILFNNEIKQNLQLDIIKKSFYEYLVLTKQNLKEVVFSTNIFRAKKEPSEKKVDVKKIDEMIKNIESEWVGR